MIYKINKNILLEESFLGFGRPEVRPDVLHDSPITDSSIIAQNFKNHSDNSHAINSSIQQYASASDIPKHLQHNYLVSHINMIPSTAGIAILSGEKLSTNTIEALKENSHLKSHFNEIVANYDKNPEHYDNEKHKLFYNAYRQDLINEQNPSDFKVSNWSSHKVRHI